MSLLTNRDYYNTTNNLFIRYSNLETKKNCTSTG